MEVDIESGGKKIIQSGSFITIHAQPSIISIKKGEEIIFCELIFVDELNGKKKVEVTSVKDKERNHVKTSFKFYNFNNTLGTSSTEPYPVALFDNGDMILIHYIQRIPCALALGMPDLLYFLKL